MKAIADAGFLIAFGNRRDRHHAWAVSLAAKITEPLLTCEAVLSEATFQLEDAAYVMSLVSDGLVRLSFDLAAHEKEVRKLAEQFASRKPDLADLCLIRMSELYRQHPVITTDERDFAIYRRNRREAIPLITPASK
jgi:uncharacterized protein